MSYPKQYEELSQTTGSPEYDQITEQMRQRDAQLRRHLRYSRIFIRILDVGFGYFSPIRLLEGVDGRISAVALMAFSLAKYYQTLNVAVDGENLWNPPDQTVLWPTYFTLVATSLTSLFAVCVLVAYYYSTHTAEKIDDWRSRFLWVLLALKMILEIATTSGMYVTGAHGPANGPQSLWYQTCTATSDSVTLFSKWINLDQYCGMQVLLRVLVTDSRFSMLWRRVNGRNGEALLRCCLLFWMLCRL